MCDAQEEKQNREGGQCADEASDRHEHLRHDEGASGAGDSVDEECHLPAEARARRRAQHRWARERVAEQPLHDDTANGQRRAGKKGRGQPVATQLEKCVAELRVCEIARADQHGERSRR